MNQAFEAWFIASFDSLVLNKIQSKTKLLAFWTQVSLNKSNNDMNNQNGKDLSFFSNHLCSNVNIQLFFLNKKSKQVTSI